MPAKTIIAVAVAETSRDINFNTANPNLSTVRPYIQGLYNWLNATGPSRADPPQPANNPPRYQIPGDYSIVYRERPVSGLAAAFQDNTALHADLWFCMSLSVARAADTVAKAQRPPLTTPIVAIVSAPQAEHFGSNVCGVSAGRDQLAAQCYQEFRARIPTVQNVFVLNRQNYDPSDRALHGITQPFTLVSVLDSDTTQQFHNKITTQIVNVNLPHKGVLVLPADRFFGAAASIVQWTGPIQTFWSTPDFPAGASGGYGYRQIDCGQFLAERVASIWKNQADSVADPIPRPRWVPIDTDYLRGRP
jgi:hypothetical protein